MNRALLAVILAACSTDGDGGTSPDAGGGNTAAWVGNWSAQGTQSTTCGAATGTSQVSGLVVIAEGPRAGTIKSTADNCVLVWDLDGGSAALESGQVCTVSVAGAIYTVTWTQSRLAMSGASIAATNTGAANNGCSFMQQVTLTKME